MPCHPRKENADEPRGPVSSRHRANARAKAKQERLTKKRLEESTFFLSVVLLRTPHMYNVPMWHLRHLRLSKDAAPSSQHER